MSGNTETQKKVPIFNPSDPRVLRSNRRRKVDVTAWGWDVKAIWKETGISEAPSEN